MLYLIQSREYIKIGYAKNVEDRMSAYKTHNPCFQLLDLILNGTEEDETEAHRKLSKFFINTSEWMSFDPEVIKVWFEMKFQLDGDTYMETPKKEMELKKDRWINISFDGNKERMRYWDDLFNIVYNKYNGKMIIPINPGTSDYDIMKKFEDSFFFFKGIQVKNKNGNITNKNAYISKEFEDRYFEFEDDDERFDLSNTFSLNINIATLQLDQHLVKCLMECLINTKGEVIPEESYISWIKKYGRVDDEEAQYYLFSLLKYEFLTFENGNITINTNHKYLKLCKQTN